MSARRVVVGVKDGKSVVLSDGSAPTEHKYASVPGHWTSIAWSTGERPTTRSVDEAAAPGISAVPRSGETRLVFVHFPPASVMFGPGFDPVRAAVEQGQHVPGFLDYFEPDAPGMHRTPTIDYAFVLEGSISLELDDGEEIVINPGDVVVQQASRHAWRNKGDQGATLGCVMIGADTA